MGEAKLNRKRRTLVRAFVQNLFTFHRQTIAEILGNETRENNCTIGR